MKITLRCIGLILLSLSRLSAQYTESGQPYSLRDKSEGVRSISRVDTLRLTPPSSERLRALREMSSDGESRVLRFAEGIETSITPATHGQWIKDAEGNQRWELTLKSEGARSLGLRFDRFVLPEGAKLYLRGRKGLLRGAYTRQSNQGGKSLNIAHFRGDFLTIELNLPSGVSPNEVDLYLGNVQYAYRDIYSTNEARASEQFNRMGEPFYNIRGTGLERLHCAPNVVAYPQYKRQARSVLLMAIEGNTMATGTLINNTNNDGTPYVLTAAHNVNRIYNKNYVARSKAEEIAKTIVFFFGFESPSADENIRGSEELTLSGAELVSYNIDADMALLKITGLPTRLDGTVGIPDYYNPYYSGWNLSPTPESQFYGIHHALASTKRVSIVRDNTLSLKDYSITKQDWQFEIDWVQKHWHIDAWEVGTTEAGASGSPLFDVNGLVIGGLSGGRSTCSSPYTDSYFAIHRTWDNAGIDTSLKPWLDPQGTGQTSLQGYDPNRVPLTRISEYYGSNTSSNKWTTYKKEDRTIGVGRLLRLSGSARPLGVYLQLGENEGIRSHTPQLEIALYPVREGEVEPIALWSTTLSQHTYLAYDASKMPLVESGQIRDAFVQANRTLGFDEVELFVPTTALADVPAGDYLLSVKTIDASPLDYPLLCALGRKQSLTSTYAGSYRYQTKDGKWHKGEAFSAQPWIDLLVLGDVEADMPIQKSAEEQAAIQSYYYQGKIYTYIKEQQAELSVYSLDGFLWKQQDLTSGEGTVDISELPQGYTYVVQIKGKQTKYSYKIIK